jgi:hypothetical protein
MPKPPDKVALALDDGDNEVNLTSVEWAIVEKYHRGGYDGNWNQTDKLVLTSALRKLYGKPSVLRDADLTKISRWIAEGRT